jgi:dipeptidyl aminopeptidase/acylaminoacyl peptidase
MSLASSCWSPVPGDDRLAFRHERDGDLRPGIWDLTTGARTDLALDLAGVLFAADWFPDATALLLVNVVEGRSHLYRYELESGALSPIATEPGYIWKARVRPDGRVWFLHEQGHRRRQVIDDSGREIVSFGATAPEARPYESWHFSNEHGQDVHGFVVTPDDSGGPFPVMMFVHGGPTWLDLDRWQPEVQAYVDLGFVIGLVNYRGSIGYGREWRDTLVGNIGGPELEDVNAGLQDLVARGLADPARAVIAGYSWGGYVTLLEVGKHPELWACGIAGVPVGDYESGYEQLSPVLQAYDRALLGGKTPAELPSSCGSATPSTSRTTSAHPCSSSSGATTHVARTARPWPTSTSSAAREHPHEVVVYETGHASYDVDEKVGARRSRPRLPPPPCLRTR